MDTNQLGWAKTQVHFLEPIFYEEYGTMNRKELAVLVKGRIEAKLQELRNEDTKQKQE
jgi:1-acyl-sn-glycerol-3-phosphate acyltransferase